MNKSVFLILVLLSTIFLAACNDKSAEDLGENIDDALNDAGNEIEDACEDIKEGVNAEDTDC